jgi:hypothetical protein
MDDHGRDTLRGLLCGLFTYSAAVPTDGGAEARPWLAIPVVGPLIATTQADFPPGTDGRPHMGLHFVNSAIQTAGISLFLIGLLAEEEFLLPNTGPSNTPGSSPSIGLGPQGVQLRHQF